MLQVDDLSRQEFVDRELALVKVRYQPEELNQLTQTAEVLAGVIAMSKQSVTFEIAGEEERVHAFISALNSFGIDGLARSGRVALKGGDEV